MNWIYYFSICENLIINYIHRFYCFSGHLLFKGVYEKTCTVSTKGMEHSSYDQNTYNCWIQKTKRTKLGFMLKCWNKTYYYKDFCHFCGLNLFMRFIWICILIAAFDQIYQQGYFGEYIKLSKLLEIFNLFPKFKWLMCFQYKFGTAPTYFFSILGFSCCSD